MGDVQSITTVDAGLNRDGDRIPLTTIFTPPLECLTRWFHHKSSTGYRHILSYSSNVTSVVSTVVVAISPKVVNYPLFDFKASLPQYLPKCNPYAIEGATYSPGVCPSGSVPSRITLYYQIRIWGAECCPSGWSTDVTSGCLTFFTTPWTAITGYTEAGTAFWDFSGYRRLTTLYTTTDSLGSMMMRTNVSSTYVLMKNTTVLSSGWASASPVVVFWQSKDLSLFPPAYASSLASRIDVPFPITQPLSVPSVSTITIQSIPTEEASTAQTPQLGAGAIAGIVIGSILGSLTIGAIIILALWSRKCRITLRKRDDGRIATELPEYNTGSGLAEANADAELLPEVSGISNGFKRFLMGKWRAEVQEDHGPIAEVDAQSVAVSEITL